MVTKVGNHVIPDPVPPLSGVETSTLPATSDIRMPELKLSAEQASRIGRPVQVGRVSPVRVGGV
jgi:hypothetical protein